jgi:hypothetical protein
LSLPLSSLLSTCCFYLHLFSHKLVASCFLSASCNIFCRRLTLMQASTKGFSNARTRTVPRYTLAPNIHVTGAPSGL